MITGTSLFFDRGRDRMTALSAQADALQSQIASGKKLTEASQDSAGWQRLQRLVQAKSDTNAYAGNIGFAKSLLEQTDTALGSITTQLTRASELAIQVNGGTLSPSARAIVADQLDAIVADLAAIGQRKDARGLPLFDASAAQIPIGEGIAVAGNEDPARVFGTIAATLTTYAASLRTAADPAAASAVAIAAVSGAIGNVTAIQGAAGARAARVELFAAAAQDAAIVTEAQRSTVEDADLTATIADLQKTMTILQATQASFTKLTSLNLFEYLR
ncbi:MAG: flagellin [Pseudomonadota bacterium]